MLTRKALGERLANLQARMPELMEDMDRFFRAFEDESDRLMGEASPQDQAYLEDALLRMCQRHGVTPQDLTP